MIYTPRSVIDLIRSPLRKDTSNVSTCTKILHEGFEISISMDSSHGPGDLFRSEIRVYEGETDKTSTFFLKDENMIAGYSTRLFKLMEQINEKVKHKVRCKHCNALVTKVDGQWKDDSHKDGTQQYCWIDPVGGSQLHEPNDDTAASSEDLQLVDEATDFVIVKVEEMLPIPVDENPFDHHSAMSMGSGLVRGWLVMHDGYGVPNKVSPLHGLYLVNRNNGQRIHLKFYKNPVQPKTFEGVN